MKFYGHTAATQSFKKQREFIQGPNKLSYRMDLSCFQHKNTVVLFELKLNNTIKSIDQTDGSNERDEL